MNAILQLVDPACAAAQEHVETKIWDFHFLSVLEYSNVLRVVDQILTFASYLISRIKLFNYNFIKSVN